MWDTTHYATAQTSEESVGERISIYCKSQNGIRLLAVNCLSMKNETVFAIFTFDFLTQEDIKTKCSCLEREGYVNLKCRPTR